MRRLKSRLAALEAKEATGGLSHADLLLLVGILARRDAIFWPWRCQVNHKPPMCEIVTQQREYLKRIAGIRVKADGQNDWKNAHEQRQRLIAAGMVDALQGGGQILSVFLTDKGEATARALVGSRLRTYHEVRAVMLPSLILRSMQSACKAVRESVLFGIDCVGCPNDWDHYNELMLPLLTCGIVTCHSDTQGRACYTHHIETVPEPIEVVVDVESHPDFDDHYIKIFDAERDLIHAAEPRDPHEVYIPLPATGWGWPCYLQESGVN